MPPTAHDLVASFVAGTYNSERPPSYFRDECAAFLRSHAPFASTLDEKDAVLTIYDVYNSVNVLTHSPDDTAVIRIFYTIYINPCTISLDDLRAAATSTIFGAIEDDDFVADDIYSLVRIYDFYIRTRQ
jgi:hypothetical protein